jgi:hypothetical protein
MLSFRRREKSFLDPSHSLGMTSLGPCLGFLAVWRDELCMVFAAALDGEKRLQPTPVI